MTANCWEDTELKCERYCWTSLFEPILLSNCITVDRVESFSSAGDEYARREVCWWVARGTKDRGEKRAARQVRGRAAEAAARDAARAAAGLMKDILLSDHAATQADKGF